MAIKSVWALQLTLLGSEAAPVGASRNGKRLAPSSLENRICMSWALVCLTRRPPVGRVIRRPSGGQSLVGRAQTRFQSGR